MLENKQNWWEWLDYWMSQDASNWHPMSWAVDGNPIIIGIHLVAGTVLASSFIALLMVYISTARRQGYTNKGQKQVTIFFSIFLLLMAATFILREVAFFVPIYWVYGAVKLLAALFSFLTTVTALRLLPYLKSLPTIKELEAVKKEREIYKKKADLLNQHIAVWQSDIGYHINLLKGQQKALADDLANKGLPVTPLEEVHKTDDGLTKAEALSSLEKIQSELDALFVSVNERPDDK